MKAVLGALTWVTLAAAALAQDANTQVAEGHRDPATARAFVDAVSIASPAAGVIGRWNVSICPGVVGASQADAQMIIDQIARRANAIGLHTGASGCSPNITIVVAPDSDRFARQLYESRREMLIGPNGIESSSLGAAALDAFVSTPRPIRWWHVSQTVMADGQVLTDASSTSLQGNGGGSARANMASANGHPGSAGGEGMGGVDMTRTYGTRVGGTTRQDFNFAVVIVDTTRVAGASMAAVADYVALVSLAEINPNLNTSSYPTILNLFATSPGQARPTQMTAWDTAYLAGLYHMTRNARNLSQQRSEIAGRIARP